MIFVAFCFSYVSLSLSKTYTIPQSLGSCRVMTLPIARLLPSDDYYQASGRLNITAAGRRVINVTRQEPSDGKK